MSSKMDLSAAARIRHAAVETFAQEGFARTTVRRIAAAAGVSAGLVIHHFGSKDALRDACDEWVMGVLRDDKTAMALGGGPSSIRALVAERPEYEPVLAYLVAGLREGGSIAEQVWERLLEVTRELLAASEAAGLMHLPEDREAAAAYLVACSCGVMLLGDRFARTLGGGSLTDPVVFTRYGLVATDIFTDGLFTPAYGDTLRAALRGDAAPSDPGGEGPSS